MSLEHLSALFVVKFVFTILNNTILNVVRLCYVHHVSESLNVKAMKTKRHLCQLANCVYDAEVREDVVQFIMQIIHGVPKLTGMGLFVIGYEFLQKFYTSMATVLVVILQMYDAARLRRIFDIIDMQ
ncbi:hypothetical protein KM043_008978 [Ampulex compressa]|nr:hypothetical protein KM043_008978 [Ampulex compressa]